MTIMEYDRHPGLCSVILNTKNENRDDSLLRMEPKNSRPRSVAAPMGWMYLQILRTL